MTLRNNLPILLIEDNPADVEMVKGYLEESTQKHDFFHAGTLFEGIQIIGGKEIELVLLDLTLPDSSGFKTLSKYLESAPTIPVIVLTGLNNEIVGNQAVRAGAQDFLVKGQFDARLLGRTIRYSIQRFKQRQKLEELANTLALSEKRYEEAQKMAQFGNWQMDLVSNEMKWTEEIYRILNIRQSSIQPTLSEYMKLVHNDDRSLVEQFFDNASKNGQLQKIEHRLIIDGKNLKYVSLQAKVYFEDITQKILLVGGLQDITERRMSEQMAIESNLTVKASKMKEEVLSNIGFHIRTPLSTITSMLYLLENTSTSSAQREFIDGIKVSVDDLSIMINNLLNFSLLISEKIVIEDEEFNVKELVKTVKKIIQIKSDNAKVKLTFNIAENLPENAIGDSRKLYQIMLNIIDNAIKFTPANGKITVSAKLREIGSKSILQFAVEDNGRGMSQNKVKELLASERLLEEKIDSSDIAKKELGVAIVLKLTKILGGNIEIHSKEGVGSTFLIDIPIKEPKQPIDMVTNSPEVPLRILIVEDHFLNQISTKKILTSWSKLISVDIAENGLIGVEKYREHGYDLILMDLQMPVMSGFEATEIIKQKSNVPIIAMTANSSKQEMDKCLESGFNAYLSKPFKPQDLYSKIMSLFVNANS